MELLGEAGERPTTTATTAMVATTAREDKKIDDVCSLPSTFTKNQKNLSKFKYEGKGPKRNDDDGQRELFDHNGAREDDELRSSPPDGRA